MKGSVLLEYLQYGRRQYGLHQYGRYKKVKDPAEKEEVAYRFGQARIRTKIDGKYSEWVIQHKPIHFKGQASLLRLKTNQNELIYSQNIQLKGQKNIIRLTSKDQQIISEMH